jgi:hypothetical protein
MPRQKITCGRREGVVSNCSAKLHDPGKPGFRRLGILPQQLRAFPFVRQQSAMFRMALSFRKASSRSKLQIICNVYTIIL